MKIDTPHQATRPADPLPLLVEYHRAGLPPLVRDLAIAEAYRRSPGLDFDLLALFLDIPLRDIDGEPVEHRRRAK